MKHFYIPFLFLILTSCTLQENKKMGYRTITVDDQFSIEIPASMIESSRFDINAQLQYFDVKGRAFLIVRAEPVSDVEFARQKTDLTGYLNMVTDLMLYNMVDTPGLSNIAKLTNGNHPTKLNDVYFTNPENGVEILTRIAAIKTENNFYRVVMSVPVVMANEWSDRFLYTISTLQELNPEEMESVLTRSERNQIIEYLESLDQADTIN